MSLFWRVFLSNVAVLAAGTLALALAPFTVSAPIHITEAVVLVIGVAVMLTVNLVLLRQLFRPLARLAGKMEDLDLLGETARIEVSSRGEVGALERAFNTMLERLEAERREAGQRAHAAEEAVRKRMARGLHDEVGQTMTGVLFQLKRVGEHLAPDDRTELADAQQAVRTCLDEVRRIAQELRPETLDHLGLVSALTSLATTFSRRTGIAVERRLANDLPELDPDLEVALYRVAQEGLTNVARHAGATTVLLALERGESTVILRVADDGAGLAPDQRDGGGLRGIRERALVLGGWVSISRRDSNGVEVRLEVPMEEW